MCAFGTLNLFLTFPKVNERLSECNRQLARQEADFGDSERARKAGENKVLNLDEKIALCEAQLEEAIYREIVKIVSHRVNTCLK